jgi:acyl carrier protein
MADMDVEGNTVIDWLRNEQILDLTEGFSTRDDLFLAGLDSMAVMQLVVAAEDRFGVVLQAADLSKDNLGTAESLAALLTTRRA